MKGQTRLLFHLHLLHQKLKSALHLHVHPRESGPRAGSNNEQSFVPHMQTCSGVCYSILHVCDPRSPISGSLADLLNREQRAESHSYLPSSAWVMVSYHLHFSLSFGEVSKWNKQSHSTEKDWTSHFDETGYCQYQPSTLQPLAIDFWLLSGLWVVRSCVLVGTVGWCCSTPGRQSCPMCDEKDMKTVLAWHINLSYFNLNAHQLLQKNIWCNSLHHEVVVHIMCLFPLWPQFIQGDERENVFFTFSKGDHHVLELTFISLKVKCLCVLGKMDTCVPLSWIKTQPMQLHRKWTVSWRVMSGTNGARNTQVLCFLLQILVIITVVC